MTRLAMFPALIAGWLILGCSDRAPTTPEKPLAMRPIDAPGLARLLEQRRGRVVLVDFWATWCRPCVELLPHTFELHRRFADRGLDVVTVSLDDPDNAAAVKKFLADRGATADNYLSTYGIGSEAFSAFDIDGGAIPHLRLYDRQGNLNKVFSSGGKSIDPAEITRAVEGLFE